MSVSSVAGIFKNTQTETNEAEECMRGTFQAQGSREMGRVSGSTRCIWGSGPQVASCWGRCLSCPLVRQFLPFAHLGNYVLRAHDLETKSPLAITD